MLEASYIVFPLEPHHTNIRKRMVKSPKLYFYDVGLASYLLGIQSADQIAVHPLRGPLFENAAIVEALKHRFNSGRRPNLSFFRDSNGLECDLFYETGRGIGAIEVKAGATISSDYFRSLNRVAEIVPDISTKAVVYGGVERQSRTDVEVVPFRGVKGLLDQLELNQDISEFVRQRRGNVPVDHDVENLNKVFGSLIRPVIDGLDPVFAQLGEGLFANPNRASYVVFGPINVNSSSLLEARHWEQTKQSFIVKAGFRLSDERPLELKHEYRLGDYTGTGNTGFSVKLSINWELRADHVRPQIAIDDAVLTRLSPKIPYSDVELRREDIDRNVGLISKALIDRINDLSRN